MVAAREEGVFEIVISDANDQVSKVVKTINTAVDMPASAETTPSERQWLEYGLGGVVPEYGKVKLYFTAKAADSIVAGSSSVHIPVTLCNLAVQGGFVSSSVLTAESFDEWNAAGATGIACAAGKKTYLGCFQLGAKLNMKLGNASVMGQDKNNGRILMVAYDDS